MVWGSRCGRLTVGRSQRQARENPLTVNQRRWWEPMLLIAYLQLVQLIDELAESAEMASVELEADSLQLRNIAVGNL